MLSVDDSSLTVLRAEIVRQAKLAETDLSVAHALAVQARELCHDAALRKVRSEELLALIDNELAKVLPEVEEGTITW